MVWTEKSVANWRIMQELKKQYGCQFHWYRNRTEVYIPPEHEWECPKIIGYIVDGEFRYECD